MPQVRCGNLGLAAVVSSAGVGDARRSQARLPEKTICSSLLSVVIRRLPLLKMAQARNLLVSELGRVRDATGFRLIGYVVMPEHVHLLISERGEGTPSTVLHR